LPGFRRVSRFHGALNFRRTWSFRRTLDRLDPCGCGRLYLALNGRRFERQA
jgi:hypothetical protein